jgi:hypothetical protein
MEKLPMPRIGMATGRAMVTAEARGALEAKRETMLSLPEWARSRIAWLGTVTVNGRTIRYLTSGLPELVTAERNVLEQRVDELETIIAPGPRDDEAKLVIVTKMLLALSSGRIAEAGGEAKGDAYLFALSEMPAWAVNLAAKAWYAGAVKDVEVADFKWEPGPAMLCKIAEGFVAPYINAAEKIKWLLEARPLDEILQ